MAVVWLRTRKEQALQYLDASAEKPTRAVCSRDCLFDWMAAWEVSKNDILMTQELKSTAASCIHCAGCGSLLVPVNGACDEHGRDGCPLARFSASALAREFVWKIQRFQELDEIDLRVWDAAEAAWEGGSGITDAEKLALYVRGLFT